MPEKCSNMDCQIVNVHGQICCKQALPEQLENKSSRQVKRYEPHKGSDGNWYCSNFDY